MLMLFMFFQNKMMVQAPKPNKKHVDVDENFENELFNVELPKHK